MVGRFLCHTLIFFIVTYLYLCEFKSFTYKKHTNIFSTFIKTSNDQNNNPSAEKSICIQSFNQKWREIKKNVIFFARLRQRHSRQMALLKWESHSRVWWDGKIIGWKKMSSRNNTEDAEYITDIQIHFLVIFTKNILL